LCFDGDAAGRRAAFRAIDRALPLLRPGRSFRFALVSGGKDPDDVLREQGAAALKSQLADTQAFAEVLFGREAELEPLDTPERRAGLKARLRAAARAIADKDLAEAYRDDLLTRFDGLFARRVQPAAAPAGGGGRAAWRRDPRRPAWADAPLRPDARGMDRRLRGSVEPVAAALAKAALTEPAWIDPHMEAFEQYGFGDPALNDLSREIIRMRLEADVLDSEALARHLASGGFGALLGAIDRAALKSGAPFLESDTPPAVARSQWSQVFEGLTRKHALDAAIESAKSDLGGRSAMEAIERMKVERDALKRAIGAKDWNCIGPGGAS
jgi:DNA primase